MTKRKVKFAVYCLKCDCKVKDAGKMERHDQAGHFVCKPNCK